MTDEELDALVHDIDHHSDNISVDEPIIDRILAAITTLRAQLAEAREQTALGMADVMAAAAKEAREKALMEAVAVATDWQNETGTDIAAAARICPQIADAILALIEADHAQP